MKFFILPAIWIVVRWLLTFAVLGTGDGGRGVGSSNGVGIHNKQGSSKINGNIIQSVL